jgi:predicted nucleotidyltransferase
MSGSATRQEPRSIDQIVEVMISIQTRVGRCSGSENVVDRISEVVRIAREALEAQPEIAVAYLFGSVARGTSGPLSDVDLGVVLTSAAATPERLGAIADRLALQLRTDRVDLIDLHRAPVPLRYRVARDGLVIVCRDHRARERFEVDAIRRHLDFDPLRQRAFAVARAAILRAG